MLVFSVTLERVKAYKGAGSGVIDMCNGERFSFAIANAVSNNPSTLHGSTTSYLFGVTPRFAKFLTYCF